MGLLQWFRLGRGEVPGDWEHFNVPPARRIELDDGSVATLNDHLMRRRTADGHWEYRRPTEQEACEQWRADQW